MFEAIVIAGGPGSRLLPFTERRPKHLLPVAGVPFLHHLLAKLSIAGAEHVVIATSHHSDAFRPALGDGSAFGMHITYIREGRPLGTAGAIKNASRHLDRARDDPLVVLNGDQLSGHSIDKQLAGIGDTGAAISLHVVDVADPHRYGCVTTDDQGSVLAFFEKSPDPVSTTVNAGCYVFTRAALEHIDDDQVISLEREVFPRLVREGVPLTSYAEDSYWLDVGTPKALLQASTDLVGGFVQSAAYPRRASARLVDESAEVIDLDLVRGAAVVGPGARVGSRAIIEGSVLMAGAVVEPGARVVRSIVGPNARIGAGALLRKVSVGDDAVVGAGCELPSGVRVACGVHIPDGAIRSART